MSELLSAAMATCVELEPAELHGTVCGLACAAVRAQLHGGEAEMAQSDDELEAPDSLDLGTVAFPMEAYLDLVGEDAVRDAVSLNDFVNLALAELDAEDLRFQPLLPDEEEPLADRLRGLAEWCSAFLAGLGAYPQAILTEQAEEILEDFSAICAIDDDVDEDEESEQQFMELAEYVKVGVLLLMRPTEDVGAAHEETLH